MGDVSKNGRGFARIKMILGRAAKRGKRMRQMDVYDAILANTCGKGATKCKDLKQGFDFGVQLGKVGLAHNAFDDAPLSVDEEGGGRGADVAPFLCDFSCVV